MFYSEPANQKPKLVVSGPQKDANPSVNGCTVTARPRFGARFDFSAPSVLLAVVDWIVPDIGYIAKGKEQCLASPLLVFIACSVFVVFVYIL